LKWIGHEADCSRSSSAEVNVWSYTSILSICLHGMTAKHKDIFTLPLPLPYQIIMSDYLK